MSNTIRNASASDVSLLVHIIRASFRDVAERFSLTPENCPKHPSNCAPAWIESAMKKDIRYFILECEGTPCGCVGVERVQPEVCYLERLAVLPQYRGRGFGRALVNRVLEQATSDGAERVEIGIIAEQHDLRDWYSNIGFLETDTAQYPHLPFTVRFMAIAL